MPDLPTMFPNFNPTEPVTKLVEAVRAGTGAWFEPTRIRRKADADAYATRVATQAESDAALIKAEGDVELHLLAMRVEERTKYLELRRQRNIDAIVEKAIDQLPSSVSNEPVDEDWVAQFFNHAQDIGDQEMQQLWAKLLACEVAQPESFSLRTLQVVRLLRPSDAKLFQHFSSYVWSGGFHLYNDLTLQIMQQKGLRYYELAHLQSLGLLSMHPSTAITIEDQHKPLEIRYFDILHTVHAQPVLQIPSYLLTDVGIELTLLCDRQPDEEYRVALVEEWRSRGANVAVTVIRESTNE